MSKSLFVQISAVLQSVNGPDGTPQTEVFLNVCRHIVPVIGAEAVQPVSQDLPQEYVLIHFCDTHCREAWNQLPHSEE